MGIRLLVGRALAVAAALVVAAGCAGDDEPSSAASQPPAWTTADPAEEGVDPGALAGADAYVRDRVPNLASLVLVRHGKLVYERYYDGVRRDDRHATYSITKSVVSVLVGIALRDGLLQSLDQRLVEFVRAPPGADPRIRSITLRHLLTMTAGFDLGGGGVESSEAVTDAAGRRLARSPGTAFEYDGGSAHLLSAVLSEATGMPAAEYAQRALFGPLGISGAEWEADTAGVSDGSGGLSLRARDLAKIGELFLRRGLWGTRRLVPERYVREATREQVAVAPPLDGYGYLWWTRAARPGTPATFAAFGYGGQFLLVYPTLDLVVVALTRPAGADAPPELQTLIFEHLLPAVRD